MWFGWSEGEKVNKFTRGFRCELVLGKGYDCGCGMKGMTEG